MSFWPANLYGNDAWKVCCSVILVTKTLIAAIVTTMKALSMMRIERGSWIAHKVATHQPKIDGEKAVVGHYPMCLVEMMMASMTKMSSVWAPLRVHSSTDGDKNLPTDIGRPPSTKVEALLIKH